MNGYLIRVRTERILVVCLLAVCGFLVHPDQTFAGLSASEPVRKSYDLFGTIPPDQLYLGMFTLHFDPKSFRERNAVNNLIGIQIEGIFVGTLINSYDKRSWAVGISRGFYRSLSKGHWSFSAGYRVGLINGYKDRETVFGTTSDMAPYADLHVQATYLDHFGIELMMTSSLSMCFFYQF